MTTKNKFYVTTPIYYPNDIPHLGHAYTTIAADIIARWNKLLSKDVFFLTGTDEHGKKLQKVAEKQNKSPKAFVDSVIPEFKSAWNKLNIHYDRFIRTTDKDHEKVVGEILNACYKNGDIYKGTYEGLYCVDCEAYYTEKDAPDKVCPIHKKALELLKEESYFFKLSKYEKYLLDLYKKNPEFISPEHKKQEVINRVKEGLKDFSISRTNFDWGIPLPFDKKHVCYVWFDALINYISGIKYLEDKKTFSKYWPADVHLIGKDILWFHTVYWPAMLKSAGIEPPKKVFAHGWWTVHNEKMGKSAGNAVKIETLVNYAGVDSARYFLFRETPFGEDGDFSENMLIERHNKELADKLGNLVSRVSTLAEKYGLTKGKTTLNSKKTIKTVEEKLENLEFDKALKEIFAFIDKINEFLQETSPWETKNTKVLYDAANAIKDSAILLSPFIPESSEKISKVFGFDISWESLETPLKVSKIKKSEILFKKIEKLEAVKQETSGKVNKTQAIEGVMDISTIKYDDFAKIDLRVGTIKKAEDIPDADKLLKLEVQIGSEKRTILAGIKKYYKKEELIGKQVTVIVNLEPRKMKGFVSQGMLLAAVDKDEDKLSLISPERKIKDGTKIS